jgi:hypothetical protein
MVAVVFQSVCRVGVVVVNVGGGGGGRQWWNFKSESYGLEKMVWEDFPPPL